MLDRAIKTHKIDKSKCSYSVNYPFSNISFSESDNNTNCSFISDLFSPTFVHVVYAGALGEKQNSVGLLSFFEELTSSMDNVRCHFFSGGSIYKLLKDANSSPSIFFHDLVPEECLYKLYSYSTVHVIPQAPNTADGSLPSKLPNLICCGVPVFAICDSNSELSKIVSDCKFGCSVNSWDKNVLTSKFDEFMSFLRKNDREYFKSVGEEYANQIFDKSKLIEVILHGKKS
jgi:colanic acid biosynthesis glycosyl transferase WcaI